MIISDIYLIILNIKINKIKLAINQNISVIAIILNPNALYKETALLIFISWTYHLVPL